MSAPKKIIIALLCVGIVSGGGVFGYKKYEKKKDAGRVVDVVPVSLLAEDYWADSSTLDATVTSGSSQNVYLDSEKLVKKLNVSVGDEVKKGDVILTYDMTVVDIQIEQNKNQIALIEQQIAEENKNLEKLKNLRPSELAPSGGGDYDYDYEEPEDEEDGYENEEDGFDGSDGSDGEEDFDSETDEKPIQLIDTLSAIGQSDSQDDDGTFYFSCSEDTQVTRTFMGMIKASGRKAILNVYDSSENLIYMWSLDGKNIGVKQIEDWCVSDGVVTKNGTVSFDSINFSAHGTFLIFTGAEYDTDDSDEDGLDEDDTDGENYADEDNAGYEEYVGDDMDDVEDDYSDYDNSDDYDYSDDGYDGDSGDDDSEDYVYTRAEIAQKVKDKEAEIKSLELDKRSAELEYKNSLKQKSDGKVVADRDGTVVRAGDEQLSGAEDSEELTSDYYPDSSDEEDGDSGSSGTPYVTIQGKEGVCIDIQVGELNLDKFAVGTVVDCMSYETGESFTAEVIKINDEPISYTSYIWNENPNSSTYTVTASVIGETSLSADNWVSVTMPQDDESLSGLYIPLQYLHKDGSNYYVMKADENGRLKKQYVKSGKVIWGYLLEIKGGISKDDMLCFPYGKNVKEGVKTRETDEVLY